MSDFVNCYQNDLPVDFMNVPISVFMDVERVESSAQRCLLVSDNPEILNSSSLPGRDGTLWHHIMRSDEQFILHRIFGWHRNETGQPLQLGVTIQNISTSSSITIQQVQREILVQPINDQMIHAGQCLVKACLSDTMEHCIPVDKEAACQRTALIESVRLEHGYFAGFIYEFTVTRDSCADVMEYAVRTVVSRDMAADLRLVHSDPLPSYGTHPRGCWSYSEVHAAMPAYIVGTECVYRVCARTKMNGAAAADLLFTVSTSDIGEGAFDNFGQFGAIYSVDIPLHNHTEREAAIRIYLNPRGGAYAGAILVDGEVKGIPIMLNNTNVCLIAAIVVPPGESSFTCKLMTAGESNLPLGIYLVS